MLDGKHRLVLRFILWLLEQLDMKIGTGCAYWYMISCTGVILLSVTSSGPARTSCSPHPLPPALSVLPADLP